MSLIQMHGELTGQAEADRALATLERRMADLRPVWRDILTDWKAQQRRVFSSQGGAIGARWPALSPRYAVWKAKHFGGGILERTGALREAVEGRGFGFSERVTAQELDFAITERVAQYQNPRRPLARFGPIEERRWLRILEAYADRAAAEAG